jgi:hypothetical protein
MVDIDAAVQAHRAKEEASATTFAEGDRIPLVPHSVFDEHDVALRQVQDEAEAERVRAFAEAGHIAAPGVGDYHATRRVSKWVDALEGTMGEAGSGREQRVQSTRDMLDAARETAGEARRVAAETAENARRQAPQGRTSRQGVMARASGPLTGGLMQGSAEGVGKSASSTGTASDDLDIDASTPGGPARAGGTLDTDQMSGEATQSDTGEAKQGGTGGASEKQGPGGDARGRGRGARGGRQSDTE